VDETLKNEWQRVKSVFEEVLLQPSERRGLYAKQLCNADETLWNEVRSLLDSYESSESFLETPAVVQVVRDCHLPDQLVPGQRLLHYEISKLIGKGGMGEIYLARDMKLDRNVAVKLLRRDLQPQIRSNERLLREARAAALLEHPNICHIHEIAEADGFSFIVMQYIAGTTLHDVLTAGDMDIETALNLGKQIANGLAEAHSHGIIHRDIKPANIIISEKGQAKILDFGLAKFVEGEATKTDKTERMMSAGGAMGTVPYMSPEQIVGDRVDARTDVFSLGTVIFEMLCGVSAFLRNSNAETISAILNEDPDWSIVPLRHRTVLQRCLAKNQSCRFKTAADVADALAGNRTNELRRDPTRSFSTRPVRIDTVSGNNSFGFFVGSDPPIGTAYSVTVQTKGHRFTPANYAVLVG